MPIAVDLTRKSRNADYFRYEALGQIFSLLSATSTETLPFEFRIGRHELSPEHVRDAVRHLCTFAEGIEVELVGTTGDVVALKCVPVEREQWIRKNGGGRAEMHPRIIDDKFAELRNTIDNERKLAEDRAAEINQLRGANNQFKKDWEARARDKIAMVTENQTRAKKLAEDIEELRKRYDALQRGYDGACKDYVNRTEQCGELEKANKFLSDQLVLERKNTQNSQDELAAAQKWAKGQNEHTIDLAARVAVLNKQVEELSASVTLACDQRDDRAGACKRAENELDQARGALRSLEKLLDVARGNFDEAKARCGELESLRAQLADVQARYEALSANLVLLLTKVSVAPLIK